MGRSKVNAWIVGVVRPPLLFVGYVSRGISGLLFPKREEQRARERQDTLAEDIRLSMPFLFHDWDTKIIPDKGTGFPPPFDYAAVIVEFLNLRARFTRGRETLIVFLAPKFSPESWHELSTILIALDIPGVRRGSIIDLTQAGKLIGQHIDSLSKALSKAAYPQLTDKLREIRERDRTVTKQLEAEINRRIYG